MKKDATKKSLIFLLCWLCFFLFILPTTLGSFSSRALVVSDLPVTMSMPPGLSEMLAQVNESRLRSSVQNIQRFGPHPTGSLALEALCSYLYSEMSAMNLSVKYDAWQQKQQSGKNIVATLYGTSSADTTVIVCAHYDSLAVSPGAEDDGSGVAAVLMIADIMRQYTFNTTVQFILFSGEEQGLLGSRSYAKNASLHSENILGVLALDKIGYAVTSSEGASLQHHANPASVWMVSLSQSVAAVYPDEIGLVVLSLPQDPESDHMSFVEQGYAGTDFVRNATNPYYHTSEDIVDHMNFSYLSKVCRLALGTVASMACLHPLLSNQDLSITMKGSRMSSPAQFAVLVQNAKGATDTVNLTVTVRLKHLFREGYVNTIKQGVFTPCNWSVTKEIAQSWEFAVAGRRFSRGFITLEVILTGRADDLYLYATRQSYGIIVSTFRVVLIPRL
ncbi:MAG TPA: hypothetical protein DSN98_04395 [Thermoplasmata archaeon]|jgi:hypothetical protein|nr:MAG TPA: hypothetical protein DSN98_04395 [Thermoplasmata archaeon]